MAIKIEYICDRCKEQISEEEEFLCYYEKKYYHIDCLISKLKRKRKDKLSGEQIQQIVEKAKKPIKTDSTSKKKKSSSKKSVVLPKLDKQQYTVENQQKEILLNSLEGIYSTNVRACPIIMRTIESLNSGKYKKFENKKISYNILNMMFNFFKQELYVTHSRVKKPFESVEMMFLYDISILGNKYDKFVYDLKMSETNEEETEKVQELSVSDYLKGRMQDGEDSNDIDLSAFSEDF